jgi:hypothetical protein
VFRDAESELESPHSAGTGRNVVAVIGVNCYPKWPLLTNAVSDAQGALAAFRRLGFEPIVPPLYDEAATADAMRALVTDQLAGLGENDSLVLFFAGHGHTVTQTFQEGDSVKTGYLIPVDGDQPGGAASHWLRLDTWLSDVARLKAKHILVFLDACYSGIALGAFIRNWRGDAGGDPLEQLRTRRSRHVITSALDDQRALDNGPVEGHSLFTGCLIEALRGGIASPGAVVTGSQIALYLQGHVRSYNSGQTPGFGTFEEDKSGELLIQIVADPAIAGAPPTRRPGPGAAPDAPPPLGTPPPLVSTREAAVRVAGDDGQDAADPADRTRVLRTIRVATASRPEAVIDWVRWPGERPIDLAIRVAAADGDHRAPVIIVDGDRDLAGPAARHGDWWQVRARVATHRFRSKRIDVRMADDPRSATRLTVVPRGLGWLSFAALLLSAAICAYVLYATFAGVPGQDWRIALAGVPLASGLAATLGATRQTLVLRGLVQLPGRALALAGALLGVALLPGLGLIAIENHLGVPAVNQRAGVAIEHGTWITGRSEELDALEEDYCTLSPRRSTETLLDLFLPRAVVFAEHPRWPMLGDGISEAERATLQVEHSMTRIDRIDAQDVRLDTCGLSDAAAAIVLDQATVHVPYDWRIAREVVAGRPVLTLHPGQRSSTLFPSTPVISAPGELKCDASGDIRLRKLDVGDATILRWDMAGPGWKSRWEGDGAVAWGCQPTDAETMALYVVTRGAPRVDVELPPDQGQVEVVLDGAKLSCNAPSPGWSVRRRPIAGGSAALVGAVDIPLNSSRAQLVAAADGSALFCGPHEDRTYEVGDYKITVSDRVSLQPKVAVVPPEPGSTFFCYYVGARQTEGPCRGSRCPARCVPTQDALRKNEAPSKRCMVCECAEEPRCER